MATWNALLDKLEPWFTRPYRRSMPHSAWNAFFYSDRALPPVEHYSWRLFFRVATPVSIFVVVLIALTQLIVFAVVRYKVPALFAPRNHKVLIGFLSREGIYWLPWALLGVFVFNYALYLPRRFFWNRRAARLGREGREKPVSTVMEEAPDPGVWPPPPKRPAV